MVVPQFIGLWSFPQCMCWISSLVSGSWISHFVSGDISKIWQISFPICSMVLVYLPPKLGQEIWVNVGKYSSTMVRIWLWDFHISVPNQTSGTGVMAHLPCFFLEGTWRRTTPASLASSDSVRLASMKSLVVGDLYHLVSYDFFWVTISTWSIILWILLTLVSCILFYDVIWGIWRTRPHGTTADNRAKNRGQVRHTAKWQFNPFPLM